VIAANKFMSHTPETDAVPGSALFRMVKDAIFALVTGPTTLMFVCAVVL
jgi:hypothetical protein